MFYEAVAADNTRTISVAVSKDGVKGWKCLGHPVLTAGNLGLWDSGDVGAPCAVPMAGPLSSQGKLGANQIPFYCLDRALHSRICCTYSAVINGSFGWVGSD
jgi:hypothetical protein